MGVLSLCRLFFIYVWLPCVLAGNMHSMFPAYFHVIPCLLSPLFRRTRVSTNAFAVREHQLMSLS